MSRREKGPRHPSRELRLLAAEEAGWRGWHGSAGGALEPGPVYEHPADASLGVNTVIAIPTRHALVLPLWLSSADDVLIEDLVRAQLERRGLLPKDGAGRPFDHWTVVRQGERALVAAVVLPSGFPDDICPADGRRFVIVARSLPLPPDRFILWAEPGGLTLAVTRGEQLVLTQHLGDTRPTAELATEILCVGLALQGDGTCESPEEIVLWGEFTPEETVLLQERLGLSVRVEPRPAPRVPVSPLRLLPAPVARAHEARRRRRRNVRVLALAAALYLAGAAVFAFRVAVLSWQNARAKAALAVHADEVRRIEGAAARWSAVRAAIDPEAYPIELLYRTTRALPSTGVRLTAFDDREGKLVLTGEASNPQLPASLFKNLKDNGDLVAYRWTPPQQPRLPNGSWRFTLEGAPPVDAQTP